MNEEEKKDNSAPWINYRTDNAEQELARQKRSANEDVNKSKKRGLAEMGDATGGEVKTQEQIRKEGANRHGKNFADRVGKKEAILPREKIKDPHLQSSTALTHPEEAKQNLKGADKARNIGKPTTPSRGGSFRGGGTPQIDEPDEILRKKSRALNPEDILSMQKGEKPFEVAMNVNQPEQKKSSFLASLDAQVNKLNINKEKGDKQKTEPEFKKQKGKGVLAEIERKVEAVQKSQIKKSSQKHPSKEVAKQAPIKPIKRGR